MVAALKDMKLVIGLLARDCKESLLRNMPRVEAIGEAFGDWHVIIYENDSRDGTAEALQQWARSNPHIVAICETTHQDTIPKKTSRSPFPLKSVHRIERMARFRNRVLDEVRARYTPDIFCFIDIDVEQFDPRQVIDAIVRAPEDWGALFANGRIAYTESDGSETFYPLQYDTFAYMPEGVDAMTTGDWIVNRHFHRVTTRLFGAALQETPYLPCSSAFNGIGIYKWEAIRDLSYRTEQTEELKPLDVSFCEHIPLNADVARKGYGLYVARDLEVIYLHKRNTLIRKFDRKMKDLQVKRLIALGDPYV